MVSFDKMQLGKGFRAKVSPAKKKRSEDKAAALRFSSIIIQGFSLGCRSPSY
jgi:hypothetical protein